MKPGLDPRSMLEVALEEARLGLAEDGIPIGAAPTDPRGRVTTWRDSPR